MSMAEVFEAEWQDKSAQQDEVAGKTNGYRKSHVRGADSVAIRIQSRVMRDLAEQGAEVESGILQNVAEGAIAAMVVMRESDVWNQNPKIMLPIRPVPYGSGNQESDFETHDKTQALFFKDRNNGFYTFLNTSRVHGRDKPSVNEHRWSHSDKLPAFHNFEYRDEIRDFRGPQCTRTVENEVREFHAATS
ncbi:hypothetical protein B0H10DRAFT_1965356 [Mycena sp. CBHHK59/15]|nr:hypothetical protein B0H10DRAFT_1971475 [Mycena sp. CBHHK59/15]KAJ6567524.1 hypothetical protein B0H10DRAFT_1965356 [Mycena sp. CBHHK59/15]